MDAPAPNGSADGIEVPSPKRRRISAGLNESEVLAPNVTSDITADIARPSSSLLQGPAPAPTTVQQQEPSAGRSEHLDSSDSIRPPLFKMKRTGTNGLPPGHSFPNGSGSGNPPPRPTPSPSFVPSFIDGIVDILSTPRPRSIESPIVPTAKTATPPRPTSAGSPNLEMANGKTPSAQSIAMKKNWESGKMAHVGQKGAETRRLNNERRMLAIAAAQGLTPQSPFPSSAPAPGSANVLSPFDYARQGLEGGTLPDTPGSARIANSASPQPGTAEAALVDYRSWRPTIGPPKKRTRTSHERTASDPATPPVQVTPFAKSLTGRPYNMTYNEHGKLIHGFGALFPDGYAPLPDPGAKGPRWPCPIKNCTRERTYLKSQGKHFMHDHQACLLNDNGDGTFSIVGYDQTQEEPIVVGRDPAGGRSLGRTSGVGTFGSQQAALGSSDEQPVTEPDDGYQVYLNAPSGRSYMLYPDGVSTAGAIIPDGYDRLLATASDTEKPVVCPIKSCLQAFEKREGLSIHFARMHGARLLNDNLDGTLTLLGWRDDDVRFQYVPKLKHKDALVVRQAVLSAEEKSIINTNVRNALIRRSVAASLPPTPAPAATSDPLPATGFTSNPTPAGATAPKHYQKPASESTPIDHLEGDALEIWKYIRPYLTQFTFCPDSAWIPDLIKLPQVRDIVWNESYIDQHGFVDRVSREIATMIIQVTGEVPDRPCSCCRDGRGPYGECILISSQAPLDARLKFHSCASCIYNAQGTRCTLKKETKRKAEADLRLLDAATYDQELPLSSLTEEQYLDRVKAYSSNVRRSERVQVQATKAQTSNTPESAKEEDSFLPDADAAEEQPPLQPFQQQQSQRALRTQTRQAQQPNPTNTSHMTIEDWELAPGHIASKSAAHANQPDEQQQPTEDIFFSHSYLSAGRAVRMHPEVSVRNYVVSSATPLRWPASRGLVRICSVAAGKVRVRIEGEGPEDVHVGPYGAFRVLPGRSCVVFNNLYGDAVLVVTEVRDY